MQAIAKVLKIHIAMGKKFKSLVSEEGLGGSTNLAKMMKTTEGCEKGI